mgnify:CR=1 FL=1
MIRVEAIWLSTEPLDMRAGVETALARVVQVFGSARPHHAYLFANARANRMKVLVHDGFGVWLAARRLNQGKFVWGNGRLGSHMTLSAEQLQALVAARGEHGLLIARKHLAWTCSGFPGAPPLRQALMQAPTPSEALALLERARQTLAPPGDQGSTAGQP